MPLIAWLDRSIQSNALYLLFLVTAYIAYLHFVEQAPFYRSLFPKTGNFYFRTAYSYFWLYLLGWGLIGALGYRYRRFGPRIKVAIFAGCALALLFHVHVHGLVPMQTCKYPPRIYYLGYGIMAAIVFYELFSTHRLHRLAAGRVVAWISRNSLWIYLWHIIPVHLMELRDLGLVEARLPGGFLFAVAVAMALTLLQDRLRALVSARLGRCRRT